MKQEELKLVIAQLLDKGSQKSLVNSLQFVQERWVEEHQYEDWIWYENYLRNVLRKLTPPKTKFISFTNGQPTKPTEVTLTIHLEGCLQPIAITVNDSSVTWVGGL